MSQVRPAEVAGMLQHRPGFFWLDGGTDGWHVLAFDPVETIQVADDWPAAARALGRVRSPDGPSPFPSGVLGYVGYGAGHAVEAVPVGAPTPEPPVFLGRYASALCYRNGRWHVHGDREYQSFVTELMLRCQERIPPPPPDVALQEASRADYLASLERVLAWVAAGDCYQINLSRVVRAPAADPFDVYLRLREANAALGAFGRLGPDLAVLSNSPETLLAIDGRQLRSDPIKGTRPRGGSKVEDDRLQQELLDSEKDQAELAMIVDLVRNDLGKVARPGSVVAQARRIRAFPTVHHAVWPVSAELDAGRDPWDALAAVFPPGSVTGAPKIRACERIHQLEPEPRGIYCGAIGFQSDTGIGRWSVAIRTGVWHAGVFRYHVGGGVVLDSDPEDEWCETVHKGTALARSVSARPASSPPTPGST